MRPKNVLVLLLLLIVTVAMLPTPAPAAGSAPNEITTPLQAMPTAETSVFELGPMIVQERIGQGETLHLAGAVRFVSGWNPSSRIGVRTYVTQPFTEGALKRPRPSLETGVFLRF